MTTPVVVVAGIGTVAGGAWSPRQVRHPCRGRRHRSRAGRGHDRRRVGEDDPASEETERACSFDDGAGWRAVTYPLVVTPVVVAGIGVVVVPPAVVTPVLGVVVLGVVTVVVAPA